jgi:hypothetical protein
MGQLLCHSRFGRGGIDWVAVRRSHSHCREATNSGGGRRGSICDADDRSFQRHFASVGGTPRSMENDWPACGSLRRHGPQGVVYAAIVVRRMRSQTVYRPQLEDWLFHALLPFAAYVLLALSALVAFSYVREALFGVGAATLLLLFIGIHNAWDAVIYHVFVNKDDAKAEQHPNEDPRKDRK